MRRIVTTIAPYRFLAFSLLIALGGSPSFADGGSPSCLSDVQGSFRRIRANRGRAVSMRTRGFFPGQTYMQNARNRLGLDNHFQGLQPLADSRYWVFTGGDFLRRKASLFVARGGDEKTDAEVIGKMDLGDRALWHAGGIARSGDVLAIPLEAYKISRRSRIVFYDVSDPRSLRPLPFTIERPHDSAGAVALGRLSDGHFLLLVYDNGIVDFYRSRSSRIADGFDGASRIRQDWRGVPELDGTNLGFVPQCDGAIYLLAFRNTGPVPPLLMNGANRASLTEFWWNEGQPEIRPLGTRRYRCGAKCNFSGAAGGYLSARGELEVWSTYSFRTFSGNRIRMKIFD